MKAPVPMVFVEPEGDKLADVLEAAQEEARRTGRDAYLQVYADWCGPCKELRAAMADPRMEAAFEGTYVVQLDHDLWRDQILLSMPGEVDTLAVPAIFAIEPDGTLGRFIDGRAWGPNTPEEMAPVLSAFFAAGSAAAETRGE